MRVDLRSTFTLAASLAAAVMLGAAGPDGEDLSRPWRAPLGAATEPVVLSRVATRLEAGQEIGTVNVGPGCTPYEYATFSGRSAEAVASRLSKVFYAQVKAGGFKGAVDPTSLFDDDGPGHSNYLIAVSLISQTVDLCFPLSPFGDDAAASGRVGYRLEWQIYSAPEKRVVAKVETSGAYILKDERWSSAKVDSALAVAVRGFLASNAFRSNFITKAKAAGEPIQAIAKEPITFVNASKGATTIAEALGSVVTVLTTSGLGSGFLIDGAGLILTNEHVVGKTKTVKVRWSDGVETHGEVVRVHTPRDVALIRTDGRGRAPLKLSASPPQPGDEVFSIGTPLDKRFQNTVTKGIVSANRTFEGMDYIQSDVSVNHGNSGGPLLDRQAKVIGLSVSGFEASGAPLGVNLFIPLRDALDFLNLKRTP